jgi:hypothetical protein
MNRPDISPCVTESRTADNNCEPHTLCKIAVAFPLQQDMQATIWTRTTASKSLTQTRHLTTVGLYYKRAVLIQSTYTEPRNRLVPPEA